MGVLVGVVVPVGVGVDVGLCVHVGVRVDVGVLVGVMVAVGVGVDVGLWVGVGVGVGVDTHCQESFAAAQPSISYISSRMLWSPARRSRSTVCD